VKGIHKKSESPLKDQTCESWALKKEKRFKPQGICNIFNKIIVEISQIFRKRCHSDTGSLQDTKQT
jgi:hypothetical protein